MTNQAKRLSDWDEKVDGHRGTFLASARGALQTTALIRHVSNDEVFHPNLLHPFTRLTKGDWVRVFVHKHSANTSKTMLTYNGKWAQVTYVSAHAYPWVSSMQDIYECILTGADGEEWDFYWSWNHFDDHRPLSKQTPLTAPPLPIRIEEHK